MTSHDYIMQAITLLNADKTQTRGKSLAAEHLKEALKGLQLHDSEVADKAKYSTEQAIAKKKLTDALAIRAASIKAQAKPLNMSQSKQKDSNVKATVK